MKEVFHPRRVAKWRRSLGVSAGAVTVIGPDISIGVTGVALLIALLCGVWELRARRRRWRG